MSEKTEPTTVDKTTLEETPLGEGFICPECGERFETASRLGMHRAKEHGYVSPRRGEARRAKKERKTTSTPRAGSKGAEINRMRRQLKDGSRALALLPFMAKGTANNLNDPRIEAIIEEKSEAFAEAWVAVAEENAMVRAALGQLLVGGVWLNAGIQTAAFAYAVAVFAQAVPLHPGAAMLMPEMRQFIFTPERPAQQQGPGPEHAAENGGDAGGAESA